MQRRDFMLKSGLLTLGLLQQGSTSANDAVLPSKESQRVGTFGVASGEPRIDGFIIWSRLPVDILAAFEGQDSIEVSWWVRSEGSESPEFKISGVAFATRSRDFTIKVLVEGLSPGHKYLYGFELGSLWASEVGHARTLPEPNAHLDELKFAYVSCQSFGTGFYTVYQALAEDNVDYCVHLGDSIYEKTKHRDNIKLVRPDAFEEAVTLEQYQDCYKRVLSDVWYREVRRRFTWIYMPDDHEVVNNYFGSDPALRLRKEAAFQAYFSYNPVADSHMNALARTFRFGDLATLFAMEERQFRDGPVCEKVFVSNLCEEAKASERTMLGTEQKKKLKGDLVTTDTAWRVLLSAVLMMPQKLINRPKNVPKHSQENDLHHFPFINELQEKWVKNTKWEDLYFNLDGWDGYPVERRELLSKLAEGNLGNTLVWTGDIHNCYAGNLQVDGKNIGYEMSTGSVSSVGASELYRYGLTNLIAAVVRHANPHMTHVNLRHHMYVRVTIRRNYSLFETVCAHTIYQPLSRSSVMARQLVKRGSAEVVELETLSTTGDSGRVFPQSGRMGHFQKH